MKTKSRRSKRAERQQQTPETAPNLPSPPTTAQRIRLAVAAALLAAWLLILVTLIAIS